MFSEDDLLPISALQHLEYCPRRCALVHVEGLWAENAQTAEGRLLHERVHAASAENSAGVRVVRGLRLASLRLGLSGVADVVEFQPDDAGRWLPYPVEYKRGKRKPEMSYRVQLCAQALCLEEMLAVAVPAGALYHGQSRRRQEVALDEALRERTESLARRLHELVAAGRTPPPKYGPKCRYCSLAGRCIPKLPPGRSARQYVAETLKETLASDRPIE